MHGRGKSRPEIFYEGRMNSAMHGESGYERLERDAYYTPAWCTEALLRHVKFEGKIWDWAHEGPAEIRWDQ